MIKQRIDAQRLSVDNSRMSNSNGTPDFKGFVDMGDSECAVSAGCLPLSSVELVPLRVLGSRSRQAMDGRVRQPASSIK